MHASGYTDTFADVRVQRYGDVLKPPSCRSAVRSTSHMPMTLVRLPVNESLVMLVVSAAKDGQEALSIFKSNDTSRIDLVLADELLPKARPQPAEGVTSHPE